MNPAMKNSYIIVTHVLNTERREQFLFMVERVLKLPDTVHCMRASYRIIFHLVVVFNRECVRQSILVDRLLLCHRMLLIRSQIIFSITVNQQFQFTEMLLGRK